jgi:hypothetical protein
MPRPPQLDVRFIAQQVWDGLPENERKPRNLIAALKQRGHVLSRGTVTRWIADWRKVESKGLLPLATDAEVQQITIEALNIPMEAFGHNLTQMNSSRMMDSIEGSIGDAADKLRLKIDTAIENLMSTEAEIHQVAGAEGQVRAVIIEKHRLAHALFGLLAQMAVSGEVVQRMRLHGTLGRLNASEADKKVAETEVMRDSNRADNAKDITPRGGGETALDILSEIAARKK